MQTTPRYHLWPGYTSSNPSLSSSLSQIGRKLSIWCLKRSSLKIPDRKVTTTSTIYSGIEEAVCPVHHLLCGKPCNSHNNCATKRLRYSSYSQEDQGLCRFCLFLWWKGGEVCKLTYISLSFCITFSCRHVFIHNLGWEFWMGHILRWYYCCDKL